MKSNRKSKATDAKATGAVTNSPVPPAISPDNIQLTTTEPTHSIKMLSVDCLPEISQHFYIGDGLLHIDETTTPDEMLALDIYDTEPVSLLPGLKTQVELLMGAGNYEYAYHHIGPYQVSLCWLIKTAAFAEATKLITDWLNYEELSDIVTIEEITLRDAEYRMLTGA